MDSMRTHHAFVVNNGGAMDVATYEAMSDVIRTDR